jgi:hypothetical protein
MFSKQDQIQGYDDALLAAMNAEEQRQRTTPAKASWKLKAAA